MERVYIYGEPEQLNHPCAMIEHYFMTDKSIIYETNKLCNEINEKKSSVNDDTCFI